MDLAAGGVSAGYVDACVVRVVLDIRNPQLRDAIPDSLDDVLRQVVGEGPGLSVLVDFLQQRLALCLANVH